MSKLTSLKGAIAKWDGKSASEIASLYENYYNSENFPAFLIRLMEETSFQKGATWLLKKYIEEKGLRDEGLIQTVYQTCDKLVVPESQLQVLQCIPHLPINSKVKNLVVKFINKSLDSDNKFIRAWAYGGFFELSLQHQ